MKHALEIVLGHSREEKLLLLKGILALGFPDGALASCKLCGRSQEMDLQQFAEEMLAVGPTCCGRKMALEDLAIARY